MVETGRASAFFMDDILLASLVASSKTPDAYVVGAEAYSVEPYGIMMRKDDPAFKKVVDNATATLYKSGAIAPIYAKWFQGKVPPKDINLALAPSPQLARVFANPTDSGDPAVYK